jgi:hypothetical protein
MEENLRTWLWFLYALSTMALIPVLIGFGMVYGILKGIRHYRETMSGRLRAARLIH